MNKVVLLAISFMTVFASCDSNKTTEEKSVEVNTDLINNPATASDGMVSPDGNVEGVTTVDAENAPQFEFEELVMNFGEISQGEKVKKRFKFTNVGKSNLIISDAKGSCGCTVPLWPRNPIAPGEEAEIEVVFDSNGKAGHQKKTVTLVANTVPNTMVIAIEGDVLVPTAETTK